jgi:RNA polymerase sigma factor (sigma-70 family)
MEHLPPRQRIAFALHDMEGLGITEIAEIVGASPQTVWARVRSARKRLRKRFGSAGAAPGAVADEQEAPG